MTFSGQDTLGSYDYGIDILSVLISLLAAFTPLDLAGRATAACGRARIIRLEVQHG